MKVFIQFDSSISRMKSLSRTLLVAVLLCTFASLVPVRLVAQSVTAQSAAAPSHEQQVIASDKAEASKVEKTDGDENDVYRHSPTVQSLAKILHVDVETAAKGFEYFNIAILILCLGIPLVKYLPKMLRARRESLSKSIEEARAATTDAKARLSAVEAKLANLDAEIAAFHKQIETESAGDEARIQSTIEEERARIVASAGQEIAQVAAQAQRGLRQFAADLAIDRAVNQLTLSDEADRALITQFAGDVATNANGRKN